MTNICIVPKFNIRTRALNNVLYYLSQIFGAVIFGFLLDTTYFKRPARAKIALGALFVLTFVIWGGGYDFQKGYTRAGTLGDEDFVPMDFKDSGYIGPSESPLLLCHQALHADGDREVFLYMFYGAYDSVWQTTSYW